MLDNKSLFGKDFKYILSMTALVWMAYTLPQVQASFTSSVGDSLADLGSSFSASASTQVAQVYSSPSPSPSPSSVCNAALFSTLSLDPSSPLTSVVSVTNTTNASYLGMPVLVFDFGASVGNLHIKNAVIHVNHTGPGYASTAYLYRGSTLIASTPVSNGVASFMNITNVTVNQGTSVPFTVKIDVYGVTGSTVQTPAVFSANILSTETIVQDSYGNGAQVSGSAYGNNISVIASGPVLTLSAPPTIIKTSIVTSSATSYQYTATYNVTIQAVGTSVTLGLPAASSPAFGSAVTPINLAQIYQNGTPISIYSLVAAYSQPTGTILSADGKSFTVSANQVVTIPVTYSFVVQNPSANVFAVQMQGINTYINGTLNYVNFMANQPAWRTISI